MLTLVKLVRQKTNQHVNRKILETLVDNDSIDVWFFPEEELSKLKTAISREQFKLKIIPDLMLLERFLIKILQPDWNRT